MTIVLKYTVTSNNVSLVLHMHPSRTQINGDRGLAQQFGYKFCDFGR